MPKWFWGIPLLNFTLLIRDSLSGLYQWQGLLICALTALVFLLISYFTTVYIGDKETMLSVR